MSRLLEPLWNRFGLTRPELRGWALYDWANSAYVTTVIAVVFPIYFASVAAADLPPAVASSRFAQASAVALALVGLMSPFLGAIADQSGRIKRLLAIFLSVGVFSTAGLFLVERGDWVAGLLLFALGNVGVTGTVVFYDALLRHITRDDELDRVSSAGYALGYLGGGVLLAVHLLWIQKPHWFGMEDAAEASRWAFLSVAVWWFVFSLPLFREVPEPRLAWPEGARPQLSPRALLLQLRETFTQMRGHPEALRMLLAYLLYSDGIGTIIRMATLYGTEVGISQGALIGALLITQMVGIPCALGLGKVADRVGAKPALLFTLVVYVGVSVLGYFMRTAVHFYALALLVGMVQGGSQALSRSLFAQMVPRHKAGQFFAFFSVFEKVTAILGPAVFALTLELTGSSRGAILSIVVFFVAGGAVLLGIDVAKGRGAARDAESRAGWAEATG